MKLSSESRVEKLEKSLTVNKELTVLDKMKIDLLLSQLEYGFGDTATPPAPVQLYGWQMRLGTTAWKKLLKELERNNRLAKDIKADNPAYWQRLANHE